MLEEPIVLILKLALGDPIYMNVGRYIWMNGKMIPSDDAKVHILTHSLHYATGVFEGMRCYNTEKGPAIFRLKDHVRRLFDSAAMYSLKIPYSAGEITEAIIETVRSSGLQDCYIRPIVYYGHKKMGLEPDPDGVDVSISCWEWKTKEMDSPGERAKISSWLRLDPRVQPVTAKSTSNYANALLSLLEAKRSGYDKAIMLNNKGEISEGSSENIFVVKDGTIITPPPDAGILLGITRDCVFEIVSANGGSVKERGVTRDDLYRADEIFVSGTAVEIRPIVAVDHVDIGDGSAGLVTQAMQRFYTNAFMGRDKRFLAWLKYV